MNNSDIHHILERCGFRLVKSYPTNGVMFSLESDSPDGGFLRVFCPYLDKKKGQVALSGVAGIVDGAFGVLGPPETLSIDLIGRHLLSLTAEWGLPWYVEPLDAEILKRVRLVGNFLESLPANRRQLRQRYESGLLEKSKLIFDKILVARYMQNVSEQ